MKFRWKQLLQCDSSALFWTGSGRTRSHASDHFGIQGRQTTEPQVDQRALGYRRRKCCRAQLHALPCMFVDHCNSRPGGWPTAILYQSGIMRFAFCRLPRRPTSPARFCGPRESLPLQSDLDQGTHCPAHGSFRSSPPFNFPWANPTTSDVKYSVERLTRIRCGRSSVPRNNHTFRNDPFPPKRTNWT